MATQLVRRLADPQPSDEHDTRMSGPEAEADWAKVRQRCLSVAVAMLEEDEVTLTPDIRDARSDAVSARHPPRHRSHRGEPPVDDRPVEFWPTAAIRAALETDDLTVWQRIVVAIKRDPYGRTARQVEEVLETARPYGVSKALSEVLNRTREHLEANECAEVARHVRLLLDRSGLGQQEFASRIGVPNEDFAAYLSGETQPAGVADDSDAPAVRPVRQDASPTRGNAD